MTDWSERVARWEPPHRWRRFLAVDAHTEGEPLRVVFSGFPDTDAGTVLERRQWARDRHDGLRRALMWEPRGHADMYGCVVGPPTSPRADVGVLFTHNEGFSTMCGHGIIGLTTVLVTCGLVDAEAPETTIAIDTPAGLVHATAHIFEGRVTRVAFRNVPSFAARLGATVSVGGVGPVRYDLAYGGAFYAYVDASDFGLELVPAETAALIDLGRRIKDEVQRSDPPHHPDSPALGFVYGTIFIGRGSDADVHSRNVCVFADGEIDRCPTGTGVSGRLAIHRARGEIDVGEEITLESILGTRFSGRVIDTARVGLHEAVVPEVSGRAWITGRNEIFIDPDDPLGEGFLLR
jgi:trans-L-3-hydroxyproline dehydratase